MKRQAEIEMQEKNAANQRKRLLREQELNIKNKYNLILEAKSEPGSFFGWWIACCVAIAGVISVLLGGMKESSLLTLSIVGGALTARLLREWLRSAKKESNSYRAAVSNCEDAIYAVRNPLPRQVPAISPSKPIAFPGEAWGNWFYILLFAASLMLIIAIFLGQALKSAAPRPYNPELISSPANSSDALTAKFGPDNTTANHPTKTTANNVPVDYVRNSESITMNTLCNKGTGTFGSDECPFHGFYADEMPKALVNDRHYFTDEYDCTFSKAHKRHSRTSGTHSYPDN
jgi:hypothetical protein